jgi:hypothetical protein
MRSAVSFLVLVLSVPVALAQRGGEFGHAGAGAGPTGIARPGSMQSGAFAGVGESAADLIVAALWVNVVSAGTAVNTGFDTPQVISGRVTRSGMTVR